MQRTEAEERLRARVAEEAQASAQRLRALLAGGRSVSHGALVAPAGELALAAQLLERAAALLRPPPAG